MSQDPIDTLQDLEMLERVRFVVHDEAVEGLSNSKVVTDERITVTVRERGGDRVFRIQSDWAHGWLEPLVDVREADRAGFRPAGTLQTVESLGYE